MQEVGERAAGKCIHTHTHRCMQYVYIYHYHSLIINMCNFLLAQSSQFMSSQVEIMLFFACMCCLFLPIYWEASMATWKLEIGRLESYSLPLG